LQRVTGYLAYKTQAGDTFDSLALQMYNDEKLAKYITDYNPDYSDVIVFDANVELRLPTVENTETPETLPPWRTSS
jgi:phage tail protein X